MNILFINDTTISRHPGSIATVQGILSMLKGIENNNINIYTLPVGYGYELLAESRGDFQDKTKARKIKESLQQIKNAIFPPLPIQVDLQKNQIMKVFDYNAWISTISLLNNEPYLTNLINWCDIVVINGEGTIHHNFYGAQVLLALAKVSKEKNKTVLLINSTIESIDEILIQESLSEIDYISVRDNDSQEYLKSFSINSHLHPDAAFSNTYKEFPGYKKRKKPPVCLISSGIEQSVELSSQLINIAKNSGYQPVYYCFDSTDKNTYKYCRANNINVIKQSTIPWWCFPSFLKQFDICISGRHHFNVFCILAETPFVPLPSTTWKIKGTIELIDHPVSVINKIENINSFLINDKEYNYFDKSKIEEVKEQSKLMIKDYYN